MECSKSYLFSRLHIVYRPGNVFGLFTTLENAYGLDFNFLFSNPKRLHFAQSDVLWAIKRNNLSRPVSETLEKNKLQNLYLIHLLRSPVDRFSPSLVYRWSRGHDKLCQVSGDQFKKFWFNIWIKIRHFPVDFIASRRLVSTSFGTFARYSAFCCNSQITSNLNSFCTNCIVHVLNNARWVTHS